MRAVRGNPNHTEVTRVAGSWLEVIASWAEGATLRWRDMYGAVRADPEGRGPNAPRAHQVLTIAHLKTTSRATIATKT